jgi:hypothetical protein
MICDVAGRICKPLAVTARLAAMRLMTGFTRATAIRGSRPARRFRPPGDARAVSYDSRSGKDTEDKTRPDCGILLSFPPKAA